MVAFATEQLYTIERMGVCFDDPTSVEAVEVLGPFNRETAKRKAIEIFETTGDGVEVYRAGEISSVASIWPDGKFMIAEEHDAEGDRLPRDGWFDFWQ